MDLTITTPSFDDHLLDCIRLKKNLEILSSLNKQVPNVVDNWGSLLHYSVLYDNAKITRHLIELGWNVNLVHCNCTSLIIAVKLGHASIVKILLESNANFMDFANDNGVTAIELAFDPSHFHPIIVESFLRKLQGTNPHIDKMIKWLFVLECSPYEATFLKNTKILEHMLKLGFDIDCRGRRQRTALHAAVELADLKLTTWLLENDAQVDAKDVDGLTPLSLLYERGVMHSLEHLSILTLLIGHGASLNHYTSSGRPLIMPIVRDCDAKVLRLLLENDLDLTLTDEKDAKTLLHALAENRNLGIVEVLRETSKFNVDLRDGRGRTALFYAVSCSNAKMVKFLLERGANPNDQDIASSPLYQGFSRNSRRSVECVRLLLEHGSDPRLLEYDGSCPTIFDFALYDGNNAKIHFVIAHLANMEMLGKPIDEFTSQEIKGVSKFRRYLQLCRKVLREEIVDEMRLIDLLTVTDDRLKIHLRDRTFVSRLRRISCKVELRESFPYYVDLLRRRVFEISREMRLKYEATVTICANFDIYHEVAELIVGNLGVKDLERVCQL